MIALKGFFFFVVLPVKLALGVSSLYTICAARASTRGKGLMSCSQELHAVSKACKRKLLSFDIYMSVLYTAL